jgi:hypothetical protein
VTPSQGRHHSHPPWPRKAPERDSQLIYAESSLTCGRGTRWGCERVAEGPAHVLLDRTGGYDHVLFCPRCCPCVVDPEQVETWAQRRQRLAHA